MYFIESLINIALWCIGLWILFLVIRQAIDGSETAENIREILKILSSKNSETSDIEKYDKGEDYSINETNIDICPACHSHVNPADKKCPSCGLPLIIEEDNNL
ncbi:hypothetical protein OXPF_00100 [Oxobacter pfennigii]|uniref:Double zinc ribbon n=1 Tax=Oxobacter pfennigii TaxID=36849 RepID=A0A0N8NU15_9CLOT|nr:hypothetical protein [Oxobacter pfennigii]KPU46368.1 hypothetical protein OXPF_00100 [Oxobacter pfennigii]